MLKDGNVRRSLTWEADLDRNIRLLAVARGMTLSALLRQLARRELADWHAALVTGGHEPPVWTRLHSHEDEDADAEEDAP